MSDEQLRVENAERERVRTLNLLGVEEAMTEPQKARLLDLCFRLNPQLRGAHVADVLDMLMDTDASLRQTEPWWDLYGDRVPEGDDALYTTALYALVWSSPTPVWDQHEPQSFDDVDDLADRARAEVRLIKAKPFKCNCGKRFPLVSEYSEHVQKHST